MLNSEEKIFHQYGDSKRKFMTGRKDSIPILLLNQKSQNTTIKTVIHINDDKSESGQGGLRRTLPSLRSPLRGPRRFTSFFEVPDPTETEDGWVKENHLLLLESGSSFPFEKDTRK